MIVIWYPILGGRGGMPNRSFLFRWISIPYFLWCQVSGRKFKKSTSNLKIKSINSQFLLLVLVKLNKSNFGLLGGKESARGLITGKAPWWWLLWKICVRIHIYTQAFAYKRCREMKKLLEMQIPFCVALCVCTLFCCQLASVYVWCVMKTGLSYNIISVSVNEHPWTGFSDAQNNMMRCRPAAWWNFSSPLAADRSGRQHWKREWRVLQSEFTIKNTLTKCRRSLVCGGENKSKGGMRKYLCKFFSMCWLWEILKITGL